METITRRAQSKPQKREKDMSQNVKMPVSKVKCDGEFIFWLAKGNEGLKVDSQSCVLDQTENLDERVLTNAVERQPQSRSEKTRDPICYNEKQHFVSLTLCSLFFSSSDNFT